MCFTKTAHIVYIFWHIFFSSSGLQNQEEDIFSEVEAVIRNTTEKIFLELNFLAEYKKWSKLLLIHNFFANVSLMDQNTFKLITTLSKVDRSDISELSSFVLKEIFKVNREQRGNGSNIVNEEDFMKKIDVLKSHQEEFYNNSAPQPETRRVYKGEMTKVKYFPFMASIHMFDSFQCGGSIIQSDLIITAASCLQPAWNNSNFRRNPDFLSVRVGSDFFDREGKNVSVHRIHFHRGYDPKNLRNNIAILRLKKHLTFVQRKVEKIEIDTNDTQLSILTNGFGIIGWGSKRPGNILIDMWSNQLSYDVLEIYDPEECTMIYSKEYVSENNFCAGYMTKGSGACSRDVGDPGVVNGVLMGIVSFGAKVCGTPDAPTVFTKVGSYASWIKKIMEKRSTATYDSTTESSKYVTRRRTTVKLRHHTVDKSTRFKSLRLGYMMPENVTVVEIKPLLMGKMMKKNLVNELKTAMYKHFVHLFF